MLLAAGRRPLEFYAAMTECAEPDVVVELMAIEFIHQAGSWLHDPDKADLVAEVDRLADGSDWQIGLTIPGWLSRWFDDQADASVALRSVLDAVAELTSTAQVCMSEFEDDRGGVVSLASRR